MATMALAALGGTIGGGIGGTFLGIGMASIGTYVGKLAGSYIDSRLFGPKPQNIEGPRLDSLSVTSSTEGLPIPRIYGRLRIGGNIIWATDFREEIVTDSVRTGKGGGNRATTTTYEYYASFAIGICEGEVGAITRIWVDGEPLSLSDVNYTVYKGTETQEPDPLITSFMGEDNTPAYRGLCYIVFNDLPLMDYGNRIPQFQFEVIKPVNNEKSAEAMVNSVTMIPASGEFVYSTDNVTVTVTNQNDPDTIEPANYGAENLPNVVRSIDNLIASCPNLKSVSLVVSWFGSDLRAGVCTIKPKVESNSATTSVDWSVNGITRAQADTVSTIGDNEVAFGGTPADITIIQTIQELKSRGIQVTFYPFIMMDIPTGNTLPNPYSNNASEVGQPIYPWRGRITCSPAPGFTGTVDKTASAQGQVDNFFGDAEALDFIIGDSSVTWDGPSNDWGLRRMILHYAHLCVVAGGVDAFLIGSEMRGLTQIRRNGNVFPAVGAFISLAEEVRTIVGFGTKISYAADWSEYFGHHPADGSGDVFFHLDPLWADDSIDFIGIDNYMPMSDWRDGETHLDYLAGWRSVYDTLYLQSNIDGGEGYDWYYASVEDRENQVRTPIDDTYDLEKDVAVEKVPAVPTQIIGKTGLLTNSYHQVLGRDGYFHPDSGTSEGQFVAIYASAKIGKVLEGVNNTVSDSYKNRSKLLASTLERSFYRRPFTGNTSDLFIPHWLNAARGDGLQLQTADLNYEIEFVPVGGNLLRAFIPAMDGGDVLLKVYSIRAMDAYLLWENPYSPVIGTTFTMANDPVITPAGATITITGSSRVKARLAYSYNRGDILEVGEPYEPWPIWRRLDPGEVSCAGDSLRWAMLAFRYMDEAHDEAVWSSMFDVTKANTVEAFKVDDGKWFLRPSRSVDPSVGGGMFTFNTRNTVWTRNSATGFLSASITSGVGESQIGRGFELSILGTDQIRVRLGTNIATNNVQVYIDTANSYDPDTRWIASLSLNGTGVQEFVLDLSDFKRMSNNAISLSGDFTAYVFGVIDTEPDNHNITIESARTVTFVYPEFSPWIVPFTVNVLGNQIIEWRGIPGSGYQAPDMWADIGGPDGPTGMEVQANFLQTAQDQWALDHSGELGPFTHAYVWDRYDGEEFNVPPGTWIYDWHDPNSRWGGYQYRPLDACARALYITNGDTDYDTARGICVTVVDRFITWLLNVGWTNTLDGPPTDFYESGAVTLYAEPHFAAMILRACINALRSTEYSANAGRSSRASSLALKAWEFMESRYVSTGNMAGTWSGGFEEWFGFWHAEILDTLADLLYNNGQYATLVGIDPDDVLDRVIQSDEWLEANSGSTLGVETGEDWVFRYKDLQGWWSNPHHNRPAGVRDELSTDWIPESKPIWFTEAGSPSVDRGTNQPNVFFDPKSSESALPYSSRGWSDDHIQRCYIKATYSYWNDPSKNIRSRITGEPMVSVPDIAYWTWDARPYPDFPAFDNIWSDSTNWLLGHWLTGRIGSADVAGLVYQLCLDAGVPADYINVDRVYGHVEGYAISGIESATTTISPLADFFLFEGYEHLGVLSFVSKELADTYTIYHDEIVLPESEDEPSLSLEHLQTSEIPAHISWSAQRADADYNVVMVESHYESSVSDVRIGENFPFAVSPINLYTQVRKRHYDTWASNITLKATLHPSYAYLHPVDVVRYVDEQDRSTDFIINQTTIDYAVDFVSSSYNRGVFDVPAYSEVVWKSGLRSLKATQYPSVIVAELPWLPSVEDLQSIQFFGYRAPWGGGLSIVRIGEPDEEEEDTNEILGTIERRAGYGYLTDDLQPHSHLYTDRSSTLRFVMYGRTLQSVNHTVAMSFDNMYLLEGVDGNHELISIRNIELVAPNTYEATVIVRGILGTEAGSRVAHLAGSRIVKVDNGIKNIPYLLEDIGQEIGYKVGPLSRPLSDPLFVDKSITVIGRAYKPYEPCIPVHPRTTRTDNNIVITWYRRDRNPAADSWNISEVPLSETLESYLLRILDESDNILREVSLSGSTFTYTNAMQIADFGNTVAINSTLSIELVQLSSFIGEGFPLKTSLRV